MNSVPGIVESIIKDDLFAQVRISYNGYIFSACILLSDDEMPYSKIGSSVIMTFKEADTIVSLHADCDVSCRNRFMSRITDIVFGPVMTRVTVDFIGMPLVSLITTESAHFLNLKKDLDIVCMVKSTSLMLYTGGNT